MSTYLLAFGFGALQGKTAKTQNGTEVGVFATVAQAENSVDFALDIAVRVIDFYEDYFQVKYPIHCHTIWLFLTSQQVPWKTGDLLPIVKFTY